MRKAIMGMFAKNTLRASISKKLRIFPGEHHLHYDMLPMGTKSILK
jgi:ribosomal protein L13